MSREFTAVVERDEDGYCVGWVPAMPGCHTQARTLDELRDRLNEAAEAWLAAANPGDAAALEFVGIQRVTVAS